MLGQDGRSMKQYAIVALMACPWLVNQCSWTEPQEPAPVVQEQEKPTPVVEEKPAPEITLDSPIQGHAYEGEVVLEPVYEQEDHTPDAPPAGQYYATIEALTKECFAGGFPESPACGEMRVEAAIRTGLDLDTLVLFEDGSITGYGCVLPEMGCG